jgi:Beta-lactamase class C and other penicillin binding proteins
MIVKDDKIVFEKCYGNYTQKKEVYIASAGKWLAAATIASVVDKTKLSWDDPVDRWLPEFKGDPKGKIILRQLLSHTSGIPDYHKRPKRDTYNKLDSAVADILPLDTIFTPGKRFEYGGLAMQVAGRMAEVASGMNFEMIFQKNICIPLKMRNTHFTPVDLGEGHSPMLGGGARTIIKDYMNFLNMIFHDGMFNGKQVISKESIQEMQSDQVRSAKVYPGEYIEKGLGLYHTGIYGLGEWREKIDKNGNAYQISSPRWAGAYPWINKHDNVYGFFLTHVEGTKMSDDGVSSFYGSPIISELTSVIVNKK